MKYRFAVMLVVFAGSLCAQDAASVLNRYVQVTGGPDLYKKYDSVHVFYTITYADKTTENVDYYHVRNGGTLIETDNGTYVRDEGVTEGVAWRYSEAKGVQILAGKEAAHVLAESKGLGEDDWHAHFPTVTLAGNQTINGAPCKHLKLTLTDGSTVDRFYDVKTGLLVRELSSEFDEQGAEQATTTDFEHYDTFFGLRRPASIHIKSGAKDMQIQVNSVTYYPGQSMAPLPHDVVRAIVSSRTKPGGLPNPIDLLDKFLAVTGGRDKYEKIKTEVVKAEVSFADENLKFPVVTYTEGNKSYSSSDIPSIGKFETGDDGATGWEKSVIMGPKLRPHAGGSEFMGPEASQVLHWSEGAVAMETVSQDQVNGAPCYQVRMGPKGDDTPTACFDIKTGLLLRTSEPGSDGSAEQLYSDYRPVNGLMICYRIDTKVAGHTASVQITDVAMNQPLPDGIFKLPPDVQALKAKRDATQSQPLNAPGAPTLKRPAQKPQ